MNAKRPNAAQDPNDEIALWAQKLQEAQQHLQELTGGQVDAVLSPSGHSYLLRDAQERLQESETNQRQLADTLVVTLNALPANIALLDSRGFILSVNDSWVRFATANSLQGPDFYVNQNYLEVCERIHGPGAEQARAAAEGIRQVLNGHSKQYSIEYCCHSPTEKHWFNLLVTPVREKSLAGAVVMHIDITARKLAEEQLLQKNALFEAQLNSTLDGILILDSDGKKILQNQRMAELWKIPPEIADETDDQRQFDWVTSRMKDPQQFVERALHLRDHTQEIGRDELELNDGTFIDRYSAPVLDQHGKYYGRIWVFRDITERKLSERIFTEQMELMSMASSTAKLGAWAIEFPGPKIVWSPEVFCIHEVDPAVVPDMDFAMGFFPPASRKKLEAAIQSEEPFDLELDFITAKGKKLWVRTTSAVERRNGKLHRFYGIFQDLTERKKAEMRFRLLIESNAQGVFFWNTKGEITGANDAWLKMVGYTREDLEAGRLKWTQLTPPELAHLDNRAIVELESRGTCTPYEKEFIRKDGSRVPILLGAAVFEDNREEGVCFAIDITKSKAAEEALRVSEERFSHAFEYAPNCMVLISPDSRFITANRLTIDLLGYSFEEFQTKKFEDVTHPEDVPKELELIRQMLAGEIHFYEMEKRYIHKQGHLIWARLNASLVRDTAGNPLYFIKQIQNITEIKRAYEQIEEQAALIDEASDAIISRDLEHRILFWSKGAQRLYGWTADEARGRFMYELLKIDAVKFAAAERTTRETGTWNGEIQNHAKNGNLLSVNGRWTLLRDAHGQPLSILTIDTDITERKKLEQQFLRAQRMESIGTLAGGIAHDLNNILSPIMMSIDLLKMIVDKPQANDILKSIEISAKRGSDIVRQVLSFARGIDGERIDVQPKHLVKDLEQILNDTFPKNIRWQFSVPNNTWLILADPTQIQQVLINLCVNARDAMPNGGLLSINVENHVLDEYYASLNPQAKAGLYVVISVMDTGTGISPEIIAKIFDPFFTTKELGQGTGLGLSTVQAIVKSHQGFMNVYSEQGKGSIFKVYLPAKGTDSSTLPEKKQEEELPRGNGETILLVEDENPVLAMTSQTLQAFGYQVLTARNGAEAVAVYAQKKDEIAVVITDMMMPVMDGPATISALQTINPGVQVIAASGLGSNRSLAKVSGIGVKYFLTKPHTAGTLLQTLRKVILQDTPTSP